jgi:hypothetical protein
MIGGPQFPCLKVQCVAHHPNRINGLLECPQDLSKMVWRLEP